jgi:hypothetical protein
MTVGARYKVLRRYNIISKTTALMTIKHLAGAY